RGGGGDRALLVRRSGDRMARPRRHRARRAQQGGAVRPALSALSTKKRVFGAAESGFDWLDHCQDTGFALYPSAVFQREERMAEGRQSGLQRPVTPSKELAEIAGSAPLPRSQVVSKVWDHIKKDNLQNPQNKREIVAAGKLRK